MWKIVTVMDRTKLWRHFSAKLSGEDVPPYALRSLAKLPDAELPRFGKAWRLLGDTTLPSAGSVVALTREGDMAVSGAGVCEALLARAWEARNRSHQLMLHLAVAAHEVAAELKASGLSNLGGAAVADLQARASGELANAYRIVGLQEEASAAFSDAFHRLHFGSRDPLLRSHLTEMKAIQLAAYDPEAALERLSTSIELYRRLGEGHLAGRVRIAQSIYMARTGKPEEALRLNAEGLSRIDRRRDPLLLKTGLHNRLLLLLGLDRREEARQTLAQCKGLGFRDLCAVTVRLWWMEGRVCHSLGELEPAEKKLDWARCGLAVLDLLYFAGVASLDLAATRLRLGRTQDARESVETAHLALQAAADDPQIQGVRARLESALEKGEVTRDLLEGTLVSLRRDEITGGPRLAA